MKTKTNILENIVEHWQASYATESPFRYARINQFVHLCVVIPTSNPSFRLSKQYKEDDLDRWRIDDTNVLCKISKCVSG